MKNETYDMIIIGGGAAGFAVASFISSMSKNSPPRPNSAQSAQMKILIIEKNREPMKKLAITGKGRCNLTNNCDIETVLRNIPKNPMFLRSALTAFSPADTMAYFEGLGVKLKTERGGRVFPVSDKAGDIVAALKRSHGARVVTDKAAELLTEGDCVTGVKCVNGVYRAPKVVIATGGMSYPATGSDGGGYRLAEQAGHTVTPIKPALVPLVIKEKFCGELAGLTLKNVKLTLKKHNKTVYSELGEMLFTHTGVSGPLVLTASCNIGNPADYTLSVDLKPALDEKTLDSRILRDFSQNKNRQIKNALSGLLPKNMIPVFTQRLFCNDCGISEQRGHGDTKPVCEITKDERRRLRALFKDFTMTVTAFCPIDEAVVTDGGVSVREINPKTMESKLVKGLYFAGEVIDVNGLTGGFNLQIAFSTACAVARGLYYTANA